MVGWFGLDVSPAPHLWIADQVRNESAICEVMRLWMVYYGCMVSVKQGLSDQGLLRANVAQW